MNGFGDGVMHFDQNAPSKGNSPMNMSLNQYVFHPGTREGSPLSQLVCTACEQVVLDNWLDADLMSLGDALFFAMEHERIAHE